MWLEFKLYEMKEESKFYKKIMESNKRNEFIVVGEAIIHGQEHYKVHQLNEDGSRMVAGITLDKLAIMIPKSDLKLQIEGIGYNTMEMDIPKEYLTLDLVEDIQRLNV